LIAQNLLKIIKVSVINIKTVAGKYNEKIVKKF
jgi:hypothetical protein